MDMQSKYWRHLEEQLCREVEDLESQGSGKSQGHV